MSTPAPSDANTAFADTIAASGSVPDSEPRNLKAGAMAKSSGMVFVGTALGRIFNFLLQLVLSNFLGVALFGSYTLGISVLTFLSSLSQAGLHQATVRFLAMARANEQPAVVRGVLRFAAGRVAFVSLALGAALLLFRETIALNIFHDRTVAQVMLWAGIVLPFLCFLTWSGFALRGFRAVVAEATVKDILHPGLLLLLCGGAAFIGLLSLQVAWLAFLLGTILTLAYSVHLIRRRLKTIAPAAPDLSIGWAMRKFSIPIWCSRLFTIVMNQGDRLLLGALSGVAQVGLYHAAYRLAAFQTLAMGSFVPMFSTAIAEAHGRNDRDAIVLYYRMVVRWALLVTLPVCLVCLTFGRELLQLFGAEFQSAVPVLVIITAASFIDAGVGPSGNFLQMIGRERAAMVLVVIASLLAVGLNVILIPRFGATGAAAGTAICMAALNLGRLFTLRRFLGVFPYTWMTLRLLMVSVVAAVLAWYAAPLGLIARGLVLIGVYGLGTILWGLNQEDREMFRKLKLRIMKQKRS